MQSVTDTTVKKWSPVESQCLPELLSIVILFTISIVKPIACESIGFIILHSTLTSSKNLLKIPTKEGSI